MSQFLLEDDLPNEMLSLVLSFLEPKSLLLLTRTNKRFNELCNCNELWKEITVSTWPNHFAKFRYDEERSSHRDEEMFLDGSCSHSDTSSRPTLEKNINWKLFYRQKLALSRSGFCKWKEITLEGSSIPCSRYACTGTRFHDSIVYIGGQQAHQLRFDDIHFFDTKTEKFSAAPREPGKTPHYSKHTCVNVNNKVYSFGGFDGFSGIFDLAVYDPTTGNWTNEVATGEVPRSRSNHAAACIGNKMYIFGGLLQKKLVDVNDFYVLDTDSLVWTKIEPADHISPEPRCGHNMVAIGKKLYVFGGGSGKSWQEKYNELWIFDPATNKWTKPSFSGDFVDASTFASCWAFGRFFFVFGGGKCSDRDQVSNNCYMLDTVSMHWTKLSFEGEPVPAERDFCCCTVVGGNAYILYGYRARPLSDFWKFVMRPDIAELLSRPVDMEQ